MKKLIYLIVLAVILGLVFAGCGGISNITTPSSTVEQGVIYLDRNGEEPCQGNYPLYAGQDNEVGEVIVTDDGEYLCVEYVLDQDALDAGWLIYETHIAVGANAGDIPQTKHKKGETYGNPKVGNFPYGDDNLGGVASYKECDIPIPVDCGVPFVIAAHAVIEREVCELIAEAGDGFWVSDTDIMVTDGNVPGAEYPENAVLAHKPGDSGSPYGPVWDDAATAAGFHAEAEWIWENYHVVHPILGDVVEFTKEFEVPGIPISGGSLWILCDNGFAVYLNDVLLGSYNLFQYPNLGDLKQPYVNTTGWQTKQIYLLDATNLIQGTNTLKIIGVNEYLDTDDDNGAGGWNPLGTVFNNPGGVIFSFCAHWDDYYECETESQTAWAAMCAPGKERFVDKGNWATYVYYEIQPVLLETVEVTPFGIATYTPIPTYSKIVLEAGKNYSLVASGFYRFANWGEYGIADAAWNYRSAAYAPNNIPGWYQQASQRLQVWIGGAAVAWQPTEYNPAHIYTLDVTGKDNMLMFTIEDDQYSDNTGSITVEIWGCPVAP